MSNHYITVQGDYPDLISQKVFGDDSFGALISVANPQYVTVMYFDANVTLQLPDITTAQVADSVANLPPWKR